MRLTRAIFTLTLAFLAASLTSPALAGRPYGGTVSVTDVAATSTLPTDANGNAARWCTITNRASSANTFDISYNSGTTYITRLPIGASITVGSANGNSSTYIANVTLVCSTASGTATAEITCGN